MQTRSPSNPSNRKRAESPDNSRNCATPSYSKDSSGHSPTSPAYSPSSPEPSFSGSKSVSKNSHQRYNRDSKPQVPAKSSPFAAFKLSSTGRPIPFKGRARNINQCWTRQSPEPSWTSVDSSLWRKESTSVSTVFWSIEESRKTYLDSSP